MTTNTLTNEQKSALLNHLAEVHMVMVKINGCLYSISEFEGHTPLCKAMNEIEDELTFAEKLIAHTTITEPGKE